MAGAVFGDVILIVPQTENGNVVRVACEERVKGVWSTMSWSSVLLCFALRHCFGKLETMSGRSMVTASGRGGLMDVLIYQFGFFEAAL